MFKYSADRLPVSIILLLSCIDFAMYIFVDSVWILTIFWFLMIIPKANICAWNHHHQHTLTFKTALPNRILEFFYALHTGATTNLWLLHHVLGHHKNYLDQAKDESRWKSQSGRVMGEIEYSFNIAFTAYYRAYQVGRRYPKQQKKFVIFTAITLAVVTFLFVLKPVSAFFLFILPMATSLLLTAWVTFEHHAELSTENEFEASANKLNRFYNIVTGNLGYHTAHHYKQGVHWSALPKLHDEIKDLIPDRLIKHTIL